MYDLVLIASVIIYLGVAIYYLRQPCAALIHPATIYLIFHGFIFVLRPIVAWVNDFQLIYRIGDFQPSMSDKVTVILAANLGFLAFMATSLLVARQPCEIRRDRFDQFEKAKLLKPFLVVCALLSPVALQSLVDNWLLSNDTTGIMAFDAHSGISYNIDGNGWFYTAQLALVPLVSIFAWLFRFRWWSMLPFAVFFFLRAGTGGRGPFIVATLAIVMLFLIEHRKRWPDWRAVLLIVVAGVTFNLVVADRGQSIRTLLVEEDQIVRQSDLVGKPLEHMDFANLEYFEYIVYVVPQRTGTYDYFLQNLQLFTEPVPRDWWPGKPKGAPIKRFELTDYGEPFGFTYSLPGAGWLALGYLGVVIQCAGFALGYGLLYRWLINGDHQSNLRIVIYTMMVAVTLITYRDGTLLTVFRVVPFYVGPVLLIWLVARGFGIPDARAMRSAAQASFSDGQGPSPTWLPPRERRRQLAQDG